MEGVLLAMIVSLDCPTIVQLPLSGTLKMVLVCRQITSVLSRFSFSSLQLSMVKMLWMAVRIIPNRTKKMLLVVKKLKKNLQKKLFQSR